MELDGQVLPGDGRGSHQPLQLLEGHGEEVYLEDTGGKAVHVTMVPIRVPQAHRLQTWLQNSRPVGSARAWPGARSISSGPIGSRPIGSGSIGSGPGSRPGSRPGSYVCPLGSHRPIGSRSGSGPISFKPISTDLAPEPQTHRLRTQLQTHRCLLVENLVPCVSALVHISHHIPYQA